MIWKYTVILLIVVTNGVISWRWDLPNLPSGKRTQYFLAADGEYKYGYDTGKGQFAKQAGDAKNEVSGHYIYKDPTGKAVDVKYTAGVNGFIPERLEALLPQVNGPYASDTQGYSYNVPATYSASASSDDLANTGDASYKFAIDTDSYKRHESSDANGNIQGHYSYSNEAGQHDLSYIAGSNTGFVATSGSLSNPNGLQGKVVPLTHSSTFGASTGSSEAYTPTIPNADGSYSFGYSTNDQSRQESADASGNIQGQYSYTNEAGAHDLAYVAGSSTGFQVTGGNLAVPIGLRGHAPISYYSSSIYRPSYIYGAAKSAAYIPTVPNADGSYAFEYATGDSSRWESADASGNVQGKYTYTNNAGTHDLSYVAGSATGFQATGGNLATPNAASQTHSIAAVPTGYLPPPTHADESQDDQANTGDASYSFTIDTDEYKRQESSDAQGNVKGSYTYKNEAGSHDLDFVAGSNTGFQPVSGSLALPNGLAGKNIASTYSTAGYLPPHSYSAKSQDDQANTGDASYNFSIDTDEYKRHESSDAKGNVQGQFSYKNKAGSHDLSYVAGSETGFRATGGSLALPNGLVGDAAQTTYSAPTTWTATNTYPTTYSTGQDEATSGDASYSFTIDTSDYKRKESSDAQGNVKGTYTYKNAAGSHDLSYEAGSSTGFVAKAGSLAVPNGVPASGALTTSYLPPQGRAYVGPIASGDATHVYSENKIGNVLVKNFQPSKTLDKYGYIFEES